MKRTIAMIMSVMVAFAFSFVMTGCGNNEEKELPEENVDYEIALVTDDGLIMDGGHSEVAWNTITEFGSTNGISHKYYKATEPTEGAFVETIKLAINKGAKIVIVDNSSMQEAVYKMQEEYPEIKFVIINADAYDAETGDILLESNTTVISFDSGQAGYLAGYAAVIEGYTNMGFIGQTDSAEIKGLGYGFIKGANRAARELGTTVNVKYVYAEDGADQDAVYKTASDMYGAGTEVILAGGSDIQEPVIEAAEAKDGKVIGSGTDQSAKSDTVITSAIYNINTALKEVLNDYEGKEFPGGEVQNYNAYNNGIGLELKNNKLNVLTQKQYDTVFDELADGSIKINTDKIESVQDLKTTNVTIE